MQDSALWPLCAQHGAQSLAQSRYLIGAADQLKKGGRRQLLNSLLALFNLIFLGPIPMQMVPPDTSRPATVA